MREVLLVLGADALICLVRLLNIVLLIFFILKLHRARNVALMPVVLLHYYGRSLLKFSQFRPHIERLLLVQILNLSCLTVLALAHESNIDDFGLISLTFLTIAL